MPKDFLPCELLIEPELERVRRFVWRTAFSAQRANFIVEGTWAGFGSDFLCQIDNAFIELFWNWNELKAIACRRPAEIETQLAKMPRITEFPMQALRCGTVVEYWTDKGLVTTRDGLICIKPAAIQLLERRFGRWNRGYFILMHKIACRLAKRGLAPCWRV